MQDHYYGDKRDVVKWASLVYLAREAHIRHVLQVAFLRDSHLEDHCLSLSGGEEVPIPDEVWQHFRNVHQIQGLARESRLQIAVFDELFEQPRVAYVTAVVECVASYDRSRVLVFLDPDVGLEPPSGPDPEHVALTELREIHKALRPGDMLALYQHARRRDSNWLANTYADFCKATMAQDAECGVAT